jgi:uncharacterized membrane protein YphA (DoxX/SURF4 family)
MQVNYVLFGCRCLLTGVFLVSTVSKVRGSAAYSNFVSATVSMLGIEVSQARALAPVVIGSECLAVILLTIPRTLVSGFILSAILLGSFLISLTRARWRNIEVNCNCFGSSDHGVGIHHIVRNVVLIAIAATGYGLATNSADFDDSRAVGLLITILAVVPCLCTVVFLDDLIYLFEG